MQSSAPLYVSRVAADMQGIANELRLQEVDRDYACRIVIGPDHIRTVESIAAAAVVVFEVIVELEGLAALQGSGALEAPAVL